MTLDIWIVLAVLVGTLVLLIQERLPPEIVAFLGVAVLLATGALPPKDALAAFSNPAPVAIAALFVLSAGLEHCGAIEAVGGFLGGHSGRTEASLLLAALPLIMLLSACVSNTLVVVFFTPVFMTLAQAHGLAASRVLIPLSFASILGGTCTLIGTSTNLLVSSFMDAHASVGPMSMFEIAKVGLPLAGLGLVYLLFVAPRLLPRRRAPGEVPKALRKEYLSELTVRSGSPLIGRNLGEGEDRESPFPKGVSVLQVTREGQHLLEPLETLVLGVGDTILLSATPEVLRDLSRMKGAQMWRGADASDDVKPREAMIFEAILGPGSPLEGRTLRDVELRKRYGAVPFAVHHHGHSVGESGRYDVPLSFGDTVLLLGTREAWERLRHAGIFMMLDEEKKARPVRREKLPWAVAILVAMIVLVTLDALPLFALAIMAALAMVLVGCVEPGEVYDSIQWNLVLLIVGMLALGSALESTGAAELLVRGIITPLSRLGPENGAFAVLAAVVLLTALMTEVVTNAAAAALMVPIAIGAAAALDIDPRPLCFGVAFGASSSFGSPISYQTNLFVYGVGGYRFTDFLRVGLPLKLLYCGAATLLIPWAWPLVART